MVTTVMSMPRTRSIEAQTTSPGAASGTITVTLADGSTRSFLEDGDTVTLTASAPGAGGGRITFGEVTGVVTPAR